MIDIVTLKKDIEENSFDKERLICICKSDSAKFIARQYAHYYANRNELTIEIVDDFNTIPTYGFVNSDILYVYKTDKLVNITTCVDRLWVICESIDKHVKDAINEDIVEFPKLEDWQIKDYIVSISHLSDKQAEELIKQYKDLIKLDIEINKLKIFSDNKFNELSDQLFFDNDSNVFDLVNGLVKRDISAVSVFLENGTEIEPFGFMALLIKNIRQVIDIQLAKNPTAESTGMSGKQFWAVSKYSCNHYSREELLYIYDILTSLDARIKSGEVDTKNVIDYIISKFMELMR